MVGCEQPTLPLAAPWRVMVSHGSRFVFARLAFISGAEDGWWAAQGSPPYGRAPYGSPPWRGLEVVVRRVALQRGGGLAEGLFGGGVGGPIGGCGAFGDGAMEGRVGPIRRARN